MTDRLRITRDRLASSLTDHRQVKQFEKLLSTLQEIETTVNEEISEATAVIEGKISELRGLLDAAKEIQIQQPAPIPTQDAYALPFAQVQQGDVSPPQDAARLETLADTLAVRPANYNVLQFNTTTNKWEARTYLRGVRYGGPTTDYSYFEDDGTLVLNGAATYWMDVDFPIVIRFAGVNVPTLVAIQGNITAPQWAINDFNVCESQELPHYWKEGTQIRWHLHMVTNGLDATDRYVNWELEWFWVNVNGVISATTTTSIEVLIPANTPNHTMLSRELSTPTLTTGLISAHVFARLRRIAVTTPGRLEPTNNPWCGMLQLHIECDTLGSRGITTK